MPDRDIDWPSTGPDDPLRKRAFAKTLRRTRQLCLALPNTAEKISRGHTPVITSGGKSLAAIGDLTHHQVLLMEKPLIEFAYDTDSKQSAQTRVRVLDMLASNRIPLIAYHFPWPGMGHVAKQGEGFRYYPAPMQMTL